MRTRSAADESAARSRAHLTLVHAPLQDIAGSLEGKLPGTVLQPAAAAPAATSNGGAADPPLHWAPSAAVWAGLQRCIASDVFLPHLADKFVRLALQLLARYAAWIDGYMRQRAEAAATAAAGGGEQQGGAAPAGAQQRQQATAGAAQQQQGDGGSGGGWEAAATPEQLAALRQDIDSLCEGLLSAYIPQLSQRLGGQGAEAAEAVASAFSEAAEQLEGAGGALMGAVAESLVDKSVVVLKQVGRACFVCVYARS